MGWVLLVKVAASASGHFYFLHGLAFPELFNSFLSFFLDLFDLLSAEFFQVVCRLFLSHFDLEGDILGYF